MKKGPLQIQGCECEYIGNKTYRVRRAGSTPGYLLLTGSAVAFEFSVDRPHRLKRLELYQTDSSKADATDNMDVYFARQKEVEGTLFQKLYKDAANVDTETIATFELNEGDYGPGNYKLSCNGTNTNRLYWELYVQLVD